MADNDDNKKLEDYFIPDHTRPWGSARVPETARIKQIRAAIEKARVKAAAKEAEFGEDPFPPKEEKKPTTTEQHVPLKISYYQFLFEGNPRNMLNTAYHKNTANDGDVIGVDMGEPLTLDELHELHGTNGNVDELAAKIFGSEPEELTKPANAASSNTHKLLQRIKRGPDGTGYAPYEGGGPGNGRTSEINRRYGISNTEAALRMIAHRAYHYTVQKAFHDAGIISKTFWQSTTVVDPNSVRKRLAATNAAGYKDGYPPMQFNAFRSVTDPETSAEDWKKHYQKVTSQLPNYKPRPPRSEEHQQALDSLAQKRHGTSFADLKDLDKKRVYDTVGKIRSKARQESK